MSPREQRMLALLHETFTPLECQLDDDSARHAGHAGAASGAGHYRLRLVSARFEGQNRISRHRLVYDCLRDLMHVDIHALNIIAVAPSELQEQPPSV
ncbi:BolA family protein [Noviherbaspirillum sedimenti]|uniref:BolA family transcriptional regulator n=1 Tax=Noviherbaspirillum sedimenti TaxID=2320865 RepID=A0A3A3FZK6_9BURK|nr:BolA family protein [Noviherbaspirillum sedimenti]RJG01101.1 BolA family transcriptional regulator [Noviherbaspirillum sedimenti]